ncbi:leucine carboxyl methyltransferase [Striga asiatica]|uniref:Leucine carboxyl methyltransferase n=1 Tax=Striga asiatica TaxID=4170 RepID=A0A5A7QZQ9_STRAF|nr:leucine carboxyl methyltransferase [Striga asiatica]
MTNCENGPGTELELPELLSSGTLRALHAAIEAEWDPTRRSACQTAAGRALWRRVINDPLAELFAGESHLRATHEKIKRDRLNNAREISGVILAVRTLWFDSKLEEALSSPDGCGAQVVLLGAGMDARSYRLSCLKDSNVFELDFPEILQAKASIIEVAAAAAANHHHRPIMTAKSLTRVAADLSEDDWFAKLQTSGFEPKKSTIWILEGILYYLTQLHAIKILKTIADKCSLTNTVLLADFMNEQAALLSGPTFHFHCDWPDQLLPSLGFSLVKLSQIGDPDANFGLLQDPLSLFNRLRALPRSTKTHPEDGTPCSRLYLLQASGSPDQT